MIKQIAITPSKCTGCSTCVLKCAITYGDSFDLRKSHIQIEKNDFEGIFRIIYASSCRNCCQCALVCPSECLAVVEAIDSKGEEPN